MSMDKPNIYEQAIEDYAIWWRKKRELDAKIEELRAERDRAQSAKAAAWMKVQQWIETKDIKPGIYRLYKGDGLYQDAILLADDNPEPAILPMFR